MKTIGKLKINTVKHLNDEELLLLRGGYDGEQHLCLFTHDGTSFFDWWYCQGGCSSAEATQQCGQHYGYGTSCDCGC